MTSAPLSLSGQPPNSNIMMMPQLGGTTFSVTNNGGWYDWLLFTQPNNNSKPLDISGMDFHAELRTSAEDASNRLDMSSKNEPPQFIVGGESGVLYFSVDVSLMKKLTQGQYVMDILVVDIDSGIVRNLCEGGPIMVTVIQGITR